MKKEIESRSTNPFGVWESYKGVGAKYSFDEQPYYHPLKDEQYAYGNMRPVCCVKTVIDRSFAPIKPEPPEFLAWFEANVIGWGEELLRVYRENGLFHAITRQINGRDEELPPIPRMCTNDD